MRKRQYLSFIVFCLFFCFLFFQSQGQCEPLNIKVGAYENPPKIFSTEDKQTVGMFPDILAYISRKENWDVEYIYGQWDQCMTRLEKGEIDIMVDVALSEEREKKFIFSSETVLINWGTLYSCQDLRVNSFFDLRGKTVAVMKGSIHTEGTNGIKSLMKNFEIECTFLEVNDYKEVFSLLKRKQADVGVVNRLFGILHQREYNVISSPVVFNPRHLRFALPKSKNQSTYIKHRIDYHLSVLKKDPGSIYYRAVGAYLSGLPTAWSITKPALLETPKLSLTPSEKSWTEKHPVVRIGIDPGFPPFEFVTEDGRYIGAASDYIQLLSTRLNIKFIPSLGLTWNNAVEKAKQRELDMLPCVGITKERRNHFTFSNPYLNFSRVIITQQNSLIKTIDDLENQKIGVQVNSSHHDYSNEMNINSVLYGTFQEALLALSKGEIDAVIGNLAVATYVIQEFGLSNLKIAEHVSHGTFPLAFAIRKDWPLLAHLIDKALLSITPEEKLSIQKKWFKIHDDKTEPTSILTTLTPEEKTWLSKHTTIRIGVDADYAPYSFTDKNNQFSGVAIDFINLINKHLNITMNPVPGLTWPEIIEAARQGTVDVIATAVKTKEREQFLDFTSIYIPTPLVIMTRQDDFSIEKPEDLAGKKIALVNGYSTSQKIINEHTSISKHMVKTALDGLRAVSSGSADAYVGVLGVNAYLCSSNGISNLKIAAGFEMKANGQCFAVRNDWPEFTSILEKVLEAIPEDQKIKILYKWVPVEVNYPGNVSISLTSKEKAWLESNPVVTVVADPDYAPVEFTDKQGIFQGISIDYIERLSKILGITFKFSHGSSWEESLFNVCNKKFDMLSSITRTPERSKNLFFTTPFLSLPQVVFTHDEVPYVKGLYELNNKKIVVVRGYAIGEFLKRDYPDIDLIEVSDIPEALHMVVTKSAYAFISSILTTSHYIRKLGYTNLKISGQTPYKYELSMAVRNDWSEFAGILQKGLDALTETTRNDIYRKWIGVTYENKIDYSIIWKISIGVFIIILISLYWNMRLARAVEKRTKELRTHREHLEELIQNRTRALESAKERAESADKLKSAFLATMSHELRTPLNSIIGFTGIILQGIAGPLNKEQKKQLNFVRTSAHHLLALINDVLDISKIESGQLEVTKGPIDVHEVLNKAVQVVRPLANRKKLPIESNVSAEIGEIISDRRRVEQVLINLLNNAVKFTDSGKVSIKADVVKNKPLEMMNIPKSAEVKSGKMSRTVRIAVADTGIGIKNDNFNNLFKPFQQIDTGTNRQYEGTGLGLSICQKLAGLLDGRIDAESDGIGKGSTFTFSLPIDVDN